MSPAQEAMRHAHRANARVEKAWMLYMMLIGKGESPEEATRTVEESMGPWADYEDKNLIDMESIYAAHAGSPHVPSLPGPSVYTAYAIARQLPNLTLEIFTDAAGCLGVYEKESDAKRFLAETVRKMADPRWKDWGIVKIGGTLLGPLPEVRK